VMRVQSTLCYVGDDRTAVAKSTRRSQPFRPGIGLLPCDEKETEKEVEFWGE
jgi:hypothetical protein